MTTIAHVRPSRAVEFLAHGGVEKFLINIIEYERPIMNYMSESRSRRRLVKPTADGPLARPFNPKNRPRRQAEWIGLGT